MEDEVKIVGTTAELGRSLTAIHGKLHAIMKEIPRIQKDSTNTNQNYDYASEKIIKETVHPLLVKYGVIFMLDIIDAKVIEDVWTNFCRYTFTDIDTGQTIDGEFIGTGLNRGDKGNYIAITGAIKYILTSTFLIPTGDDAEKDAGRTTAIVAAPATPKRNWAPGAAVPVVMNYKDKTIVPVPQPTPNHIAIAPDVEWGQYVIHFGKNKGTSLRDLYSNEGGKRSLRWYAEDWHPKPFGSNTDISMNDKALREGLDKFLDWKQGQIRAEQSEANEEHTERTPQTHEDGSDKVKQWEPEAGDKVPF